MWIAIHSLLALILGTLAVIVGTETWIVLAVASEGLIGFVWLVFEAGPGRGRPANLVTGFRLITALASVSIAAVVPVTSGPAYAIVLAMLIAGETSDFFDGFVARRTGATSFGGRFDAETDAFFILALAVIAVRWLDLPRWVLLAGLLRYSFYFVFLGLPQKVVAGASHELTLGTLPRSFSLFAKSACATATILLLFSIGPLFSTSVRVAGGAVAVAVLAISFLLEAVLRVVGAKGDTRVSHPPGLRRGVFRSVVTYYGVPFRLVRTRRFYSRFVVPNGLVFDIGAHVGSKIRTFRSLGARVIAVEPQPACLDLLQRWYGDDEQVVILGAACGEERSSTTLRVSTSHPTLSTMSEGWIRSIQHHYSRSQIEWDLTVEVEVLTLDEMIVRFGTPDFVKIDVEGLEASVLRGLTYSLPALSFEFLPASIDSAVESVKVVAELGEYRFNYSPVEKMCFASPTWLNSEEITHTLSGFAPTDRSGDIYAVRSESQT